MEPLDPMDPLNSMELLDPMGPLNSMELQDPMTPRLPTTSHELTGFHGMGPLDPIDHWTLICWFGPHLAL